MVLDRETLLQRTYELNGSTLPVAVVGDPGAPQASLSEFGSVTTEGGSAWAFIGHGGVAISVGGCQRRSAGSLRQ
jgi:hypothetical protein